MVSLYRVVVKPIEGEALLMNLFEAKSDAEMVFSKITSNAEPYKDLVEATPYGSLIARYEELSNGVWTLVTSQMLIRSGRGE